MARKKYRFDEAKIARFHKEGRGEGVGADYRPWLKIGDVPSSGRSHRPRGIKTGRVHHFLSDIEHGLFLILDWCDSVLDIREQFPLDRADTQRLAEAMGIAHPQDLHSRTPLVMTTDFLVDVNDGGRIVQHARAVKPAAQLDHPRTLAKLAIEQAYWTEKGVGWGIVTDSDLPSIVIKNLNWIHQHAHLDELSQPYDGYVREKAGLLIQELPNSGRTTLGHFCDDMDLLLQLERGTALLLVRHLLARKIIRFPMDSMVIDGRTSLSLFSVTSAHQSLSPRLREVG